jgi:hypothetical protein
VLINAIYLLCLRNPELSEVRCIFTVFFILIFYFISFAGPPVQIKPEPGYVTSINWITIWLSFFFGVLFTMLFRFLNGNTKQPDQRSNAGLPLSGWVVFLGVNLMARMVIQAYFFWDAGYFVRNVWIHAAQAGGLAYQSLFLCEMFLSLFALTGTGALIYWYFGKRDIFPSMFVYYAGFYVIAIIILQIVYNLMKIPADLVSIRQNNIIQGFRIFYGAVWVIFVLRSEQVKQTFIYPPG